MPEGLSGAEVAHRLAEHDEKRHSRNQRILEIVEGILLAIVAVAAAWSGYQAATWSGQQSELYGLASKYRVQADLLATEGGQQRLYDTTTFNSWLQAETLGNHEAARVFERRFRPEYRPAFAAWIRTDPFHNPHAPPGPVFMPQYHNASAERAARLEVRAGATFEQGTKARDRSDDYVRNTVLLATVLFLAAIAQRFTVVKVRLGLIAVAGALLIVAVFAIVTYPVG